MAQWSGRFPFVRSSAKLVLGLVVGWWVGGLGLKKVHYCNKDINGTLEIKRHGFNPG